MLKCEICKNNFDAEHVLHLVKCNHFCCFECLCKYITKHLAVTVNCPILGCKKNISDRNLRECLSNQQIICYENMSLNSANKTLIKCFTKFCPISVICEDKNVIFQCSYCGQPNCLKCNKRHYPQNECFSQINDNSLDLIAREIINNKKRAEIEELDKSLDLLHNPDNFECNICVTFIAPRKGHIFRNCLHSICKSCLKKTFNEHIFLNQLTCPICKIPLDQRESKEIIGLKKLSMMMIKEKRLQFFHCKTPDCNYFWEISRSHGFITCSNCNVENCLDCLAIHKNMTCENYRKTPNYQQENRFSEKNKKVVCHNCGKVLIHASGCGSIPCDNCNHNTCLFTGLDVGPLGCKCTSEVKCHKDCLHGCNVD